MKSYLTLYNERLELQEMLPGLSFDNPTQAQLNEHADVRIHIENITSKINALEGSPGGYRTGDTQSRLDVSRQAADAKRKRRLF